MTLADIVTFKRAGAMEAFSCPRFRVQYVVGNRIWLSDNAWVDVTESHAEILRKLQWSE